MVTSSAVVGSSQMSSWAGRIGAMAIIARWRWPPDSWCGIGIDRSSGSGDAGALQQLDDPRTRRILGAAPRAAQHFGDLVAHGVQRV